MARECGGLPFVVDSGQRFASKVTEIQRLSRRVQIWSGRLTGHLKADDVELLDSQEKDRYLSFRDAVRAARYAAAHAAVRRHMGDLLNHAPAKLRFGRHPCAGCGDPGHGRPFIQVPRTTWELSLSRSGPYWLCAVADGMRVGADIEMLRRVDVPRLAGAVLTNSEQSYLNEIHTARKPAEFIRCWTRKEALAKASGIGIETALGELESRPDRRRGLVRHAVAGCPVDMWSVQDLPAGRDHFAALALPAEYASAHD
jgi:4'-phosphopantetheinyl transferase